MDIQFELPNGKIYKLYYQTVSPKIGDRIFFHLDQSTYIVETVARSIYNKTSDGSILDVKTEEFVAILRRLS